ncbi:hypothetical protein PI124_g11355 [Phytophthora idaei]|nr:hypothetical protein PI125_g10775 [Phytophthora idaei]KAG3153437.1 hypothetical protein PI126_g10089 [Phytophthora idaei]KAG3243839.1 hypothetical protein PI124_g11355 [Phytophthora idaei]
MADDDTIIRRRLLTRTSTVGKTGLKKCAETMLSLVELLTDESVDDATCKQELGGLFWEMEQLQFEANKTEIWNYTCDRELEESKCMWRRRKEIEAEIEGQKKRLEEVSTAIEAVDGKLDLRTKQFALLMNTIQNLKATLDEDAVMDEEQQDEDEEMEDVESKEKENGRSPSSS